MWAWKWKCIDVKWVFFEQIYNKPPKNFVPKTCSKKLLGENTCMLMRLQENSTKTL
jgi:hypothetical protein